MGGASVEGKVLVLALELVEMSERELVLELAQGLVLARARVMAGVWAKESERGMVEA